ncbi:MAG: hypothetical protein DIU68_006825 [Chloroflexota bacterium]|nr:MAG: hypothetical protein DIU68_05660 [Chloroflexota bacterium]
MIPLTLDHIKALAQETRSPSISIYMPTHRPGLDAQQDPIRFKNLLREAERRLLARGLGPRIVGALLEPAERLLDEGTFWRNQYDGLAVFIAEDEFHTYRLPFKVDERVVIAGSYYIKPVLPLFTLNGHYYILAVSQKEIRLFEGTRYTIGQIDLPEGVPTSIDEVFEAGVPEKQLQFHSRGPQGGIRDSIFHGHGPGDENLKVRIENYLNRVDAGLRPVLQDEQAPLVLAAVDYLHAIYRRVSDYPLVMTDGIIGNPENLRPEDLQQQAWPIVEPYFQRELETAITQFHELRGAGQSTDRVEEAVAAAHFGRVDKLIIAHDSNIWGAFDAATGKVLHYQEGQSAEDDLALDDYAAMQTLRNGGTVYALTQAEMPTDSPLAAILRY